MNSQKALLFRLFKQYPIRIVKDNFSLSGRQDSVIQTIVDKLGKSTILDFSVDYFDFTKQHIHLFKHNISLRELSNQMLFHRSPYRSIQKSGVYNSFYFHTISFNLIAQDPLEELELKFIWPFRINIAAKTVAVAFTILERNIATYLPEGRIILKIGRKTDEEIILKSIFHHLSKFGILEPLDINKGIKKLWKNDLVDAPFMKYRKPKSISTEAMDENYTVKQAYPELFEDAMKRPLDKMVFKFLAEDKQYVDHFTVEPSFGRLIFPTFAQSGDQIGNTIREILKAN